MFRHTRLFVVLLAALLSVAPRAFAQFGLPNEIVQAPAALTNDQKAQVQKHIDDQMAKIESKETDKVRQASEVMAGRRAIIEPLTSNASVPFRFAYAEALEPRLRALIQSGNEMQQVNALVIAAELGTNRSLALIQIGRTNAAASVRFQAAAATRRLLDSLVGVQNQAINPGDLTRLLRDTGNALTTEKDPQVIAGQIAALSAGLSLTTTRLAAAQELSDALASIACRQKEGALPPRVLDAVATALGTVRDQLLNAGANVPAVLSKTAADCAISCLAHTREVIKGGKLSPTSTETASGRDEYADFANLASTLLQLAGNVSVPAITVPAAKTIAQDIKANNVQQDATAVKSLTEVVDAAAAGFKLGADPCKRQPR